MSFAEVVVSVHSHEIIGLLCHTPQDRAELKPEWSLDQHHSSRAAHEFSGDPNSPEEAQAKG